MAKKKEELAPHFDYISFLNESVNDVATRLNYDSDPIEAATPMSTGMLVLDLLYGGGIRAGWYTHFGKEQSSKTTGTLVIGASAVKQGVPLIAYFDYEGSTANSTPYIQSILKTCGVNKSITEVFGQRDVDSGKWITPPIIRFHPESVGERFFDYLASVLRALPDKKKVNGKWWLIYEDTKQNKAKIGEFANPAMAKKYGHGLWVEAENGELQGLFIVDSYPAMNPQSNDEDEQDNSIALQARMFSKQLPRVKGRLMQKMVAVIGTNQLRDAPMVMYGPKENEPGGQALKFNCFGENTLLHTKYGLLKAKEYHAFNNHTHLQSITGMEKCNGWKSVGFSNTITVESDFGYGVTGKPGHKILITSCSEKQYPTLKWVTLADFKNLSLDKLGKYIAVSINEVEKPTEYQKVHFCSVGTIMPSTQLKQQNLDLVCDEKLSELLGWIVSEGFVRKDYTATNISNTNKQYLNRIGQLCKTIGLPFSIREKCVEIYSVLFNQWLASIGLQTLSRFKEIPLIIRCSPASVQLAFLRGLFAGDASATEKETNYFSISNELLNQLQIMLLSFGIISRKDKYVNNNQEHRYELTSEELRVSVGDLLDVSKECALTRRFKTGSIHITGENHSKLRKLIGWKVKSLTSNNGNTKYDVLPELFSNFKRNRKPKVYEWFKRHIMKRNDYVNWRISQFYDGWFDDYLNDGKDLRTSQERESWVNEGLQIKKFIDFTKDHNIIWRRITNVSVGVNQICYDANMPDTHTIITNGIASHNSDCRCKFTPRTSGQPLWPKNFDKETGFEVEKSVEYEKGTDSYRYIQLKTVKNKLSSPNRIGWVRIWNCDGSGNARGYDPVFDTLYYLFMTGQLVGRGRKSMKLQLQDTDSVSTNWDELKSWILGSRDKKIEICKKLGYKKPFDLRKFCFTQLKRGVGEKLYVKRSQSGNVEESED